MTSSKNDSEKVIEVRELTDILRTDPIFGRLRKELEKKGNNWRTSYMAGMISSEDDTIVAAIVDSECRIWFLETDKDFRISEWRKVQDIATLDGYFDATRTAVELMASERDEQL
jgi:hypothetical protein